MTEEYASNDTFDPVKLNRKTFFVGTGTQISNILTSPTTGKGVYCTATNASFTLDKISHYNGTSWNNPHITANTESSTTIGSSSADVAITTRRYYQYFTLESVYKFYVITAIEWVVSNGFGSVTLRGGVDLVDAVAFPVQVNTPLVALTPIETGADNTTVKISTSFSRVLRGGALLGVWTGYQSGGRLRGQTGIGAANRLKIVTTATPDMADSTAWTSDTNSVYTKVYYVGYS